MHKPSISHFWLKRKKTNTLNSLQGEIKGCPWKPLACSAKWEPRDHFTRYLSFSPRCGRSKTELVFYFPELGICIPRPDHCLLPSGLFPFLSNNLNLWSTRIPLVSGEWRQKESSDFLPSPAGLPKQKALRKAEQCQASVYSVKARAQYSLFASGQIHL